MKNADENGDRYPRGSGSGAVRGVPLLSRTIQRGKRMYKFTAKEKMNALKALHSSNCLTICRRYKVSRVTLWRWKRQYDGNLESLEPKFSRKNIHHPNEQTDEEKKNIQNLVRRNPDIGLNELYGKLYRDYGYRRNPVTLYRFLRKNDIKASKPRQTYKPKPYITPLEVGDKWQLDVKYVPFECYSGNGACERCFQYTVIDEATRKRYIRAYKEQCQESTIDFILRAFKFFGYVPKMIQTDNGQEFTFLGGRTKDGRIHKFDRLCSHFGIEHKLIRPRTPRHNGKVERSHRNDNERFYRFLRYYSFDDLQAQMSVYLRRSNNIPTSVLRSKDDKRRWLSPNEKEQELLSS